MSPHAGACMLHVRFMRMLFVSEGNKMVTGACQAARLLIFFLRFAGMTGEVRKGAGERD